MPIFLIICLFGKSYLIGFKICLEEKKFINCVPIRNTINNEVNTAKPVLTVKYLKTLRNVYVSINSSIRLYNI